MGPGQTAFTRIPSAAWSIAIPRVSPAAAALSHDRDRRLRAERVALEVHTEDLVPALGAGLDHRVIQPDPGVVDEDVEPAEALRRVPDEGCGLGLALDVRFHEHRL